MGTPNLLPSQRNAIVGIIDPDLNGVGDLFTEFADMGQFDAMMAIIAVGAITATGTVDAKLEQAQDSSGTGVKDVTGKAITQLTQAGGDSDTQAIINIFSSELDTNDGFSFVRVKLTIGTASADSGVTLLGTDARYGPAEADDKDLASVIEIVA